MYYYILGEQKIKQRDEIYPLSPSAQYRTTALNQKYAKTQSDALEAFEERSCQINWVHVTISSCCIQCAFDEVRQCYLIRQEKIITVTNGLFVYCKRKNLIAFNENKEDSSNIQSIVHLI